MKINTLKTTPKAPKSGGFTEYTFTNGEWEIMVHHDSNHKVIAVYTYREDAEEINSGNYDGQNGKPLRPFVWSEGKNPAFVHLSKGQIRRFVCEFIDSGELICTELENGE